MKTLPVWSSDGRSIVYQSNLGGQADLWEIDRRTGQQRRRTTSPAVERPESVSIDGSVSFQLIDESAALWSWPIGAPSAGRPLNEEALSAFAPSLSSDGRVLAFQRSLPSPGEGFLLFDSRLVVGEIDRQSLRNLIDVRDGFLPRLSPDGSRLAYFQRSDPARVLVMTRATGETLTLSESGALASNLPTFPVVWFAQPLVWSPTSDALYFADRDGASTGIRRFSVADGLKGMKTLDTITTGVSDLQISPTGRSLAVVTVRSTPGEQTGSRERSYELIVYDLSTNNREVWATFTASGRVTCRGWSADGKRAVLTRSVSIQDDRTHTIEVIEVSGPKQMRSLGTVDHVVVETLRVPQSKNALYMTRSELGVANIYAFALDTRSLTAMTDNSLVDVTFANVESFGADRLAGVRDVRKHDIWLLDARSQMTPAVPPVSR